MNVLVTIIAVAAIGGGLDLGERLSKSVDDVVDQVNQAVEDLCPEDCGVLACRKVVRDGGSVTRFRISPSRFRFSQRCVVRPRCRKAAEEPTEEPVEAPAAPEAGDEASVPAVPSVFGVFNRTRARFGLPPLTEDPELTRLARIRLQVNIDRGHWGHPPLSLPLGCAEGCGSSLSIEKANVCYLKTRTYKRAGFAMAKMDDGRIWQLALFSR